MERGAQALRERPEVLAVVLFGSLAQGQATAMSDEDLFLLLWEREGAWTSFYRAAQEAGVDGRYRKTWGVRRGSSP